MDLEVGAMAGEIWRHVAAQGETSTLRLRSELKVSQSLLFLGLGWLAREGKIELDYHDRAYFVRLRS